MPISLISCISIASSCSKFLELQGTRNLMETINSITDDIEIIKYRKFKTAMNLMSDAKNCQKEDNAEFFIREACIYFVEAINTLNADKIWEKTNQKLSLIESIDFASSFIPAVSYLEKIPGISTLDNRLKKREEQRVQRVYSDMEYHTTACIGAGVCMFHLKEYDNAFAYFDKALFFWAKQKIFIDKLFTENMFFNCGNIFCKLFNVGVVGSCSEIFECIQVLQSVCNEYEEIRKRTNLYILKEAFDIYKTNNK